MELRAEVRWRFAVQVVAIGLASLFALGGLGKLDAVWQLWTYTSLADGAFPWAVGLAAGVGVWELFLAGYLVTSRGSFVSLCLVAGTLMAFVAYLSTLVLSGGSSCPCLGDAFGLHPQSMLVMDSTLLIAVVGVLLVRRRFRSLGSEWRLSMAPVVASLVPIVAIGISGAQRSIVAVAHPSPTELESDTSGVTALTVRNASTERLKLVGARNTCSARVVHVKPVDLYPGEQAVIEVAMPPKTTVFRKDTLGFFVVRRGHLSEYRVPVFR